MKPLLFIFFLFLIACNNNKTKINKKDVEWSELPTVEALEKFKLTDFSRALEDSIDINKNTIYAPTLLFAWDEVESILKSPIVANDSNSTHFKNLVASQSHLNSLLDSEYTVNTSLQDGVISVWAFFNKTLPFANKMQILDSPIFFNEAKVASFGMKYFETKVAQQAQILYYNDDNNFVFKLAPKDNQHEILLVKGLKGFKTLAEAVQQTYLLIEKGKVEANKDELGWKYEITLGDEFAIPIIKFNINTSYPTLEGQHFYTKDGSPHVINECWQRNAFILNENGAVVESEALVKVDSAVSEPIIKHPKKIIFDKSFLIIVKRVEQKNPYMVIKIANPELLIKKE